MILSGERNSDFMEQLYTVKINAEQFPSLDECTKETEIELVSIENGCNIIELMIESNESDNVIEPEYQEPTYIVYVTVDGNTVDRLVCPYDFENMEVREMISVLVELFMEKCR